MPNKISTQHSKSQHSRIGNNGGINGAKTKQVSDVAKSTTTRYIKTKVTQQQQQQAPTANQQKQQQQQQLQQPTNILNVAEMLLHGVADHEILDIWLQSISCQEFTTNFQQAGYDMPTISRITPQDLTAVGITDPSKRLKILSEIKKLNLQDGIPNFRPANLSHWLSLLRLDSHYLDSLCDQQIDTIDKMCQLTWEDFEELGITKLGHQKRLLLAIERMKELDSNAAKAASKTISEPIYDTNPSQILLVASAENHSMNGPIINKQSSTSELSSTGSGSMHSVYSSNSAHYQPNYATLPSIHQQPERNQQPHQQTNHTTQQQKQVIYSQAPPMQAMQQPSPPNFNQQATTLPSPFHQLHTSHYQSTQTILPTPQSINSIYDIDTGNGRNIMVPQANRQSLGQLPFSALANLPQHQLQQLQQSSIYATLSRQPQRAKQPPPPVPVRTNSLTSNSLIDNDTSRQQRQNMAASNYQSSQTLGYSQANAISTLLRLGTRAINRNPCSTQTLLSKNKSFSGNAYMDAARARFLDRNNMNQQNLANYSAQPDRNPTIQCGLDRNQSSAKNLIYGSNQSNFIKNNLASVQQTTDGDNLSVYSRHSLATTASVADSQSNTLNMHSSNMGRPPFQQKCLEAIKSQIMDDTAIDHMKRNGNVFNRQSDTYSAKSLVLQSTNVSNSPIPSDHHMGSSQDSGSSQTLYNSASSGSNDRSPHASNFPQLGNLVSQHSSSSIATLNDVNSMFGQQQMADTLKQHANDRNQDDLSSRCKASTSECNATTGKDDEFPPPPSPLSLTDSDEHDLLSLNADKNFAGISNGLTAFRVGI